MALSREEIIAAIGDKKREVERIDVPEWGGTVCIRRLSVADLKATGFLEGINDSGEVPIRVLLACIADENGDALFTMDDADILANADFQTVLTVFTEAARVNGLSSKELEEAVAAFAAAQRDDSSTG